MDGVSFISELQEHRARDVDVGQVRRVTGKRT